MKKGTYLVIICFLILLISSCTRYIDKVSNQKVVAIQEGTLSMYPDSNVLVYRSSVGIKMDNEVREPKSFYTRIPKKLVWYELANSQTFAFYYKDQQAILIFIDKSDNITSNTPSFQPSKDEIASLLSTYSPNNKKYDIRTYKTRNDRKNLVLKKGAATILLYNIKPSNLQAYSGELQQFNFL